MTGKELTKVLEEVQRKEIYTKRPVKYRKSLYISAKSRITHENHSFLTTFLARKVYMKYKFIYC